MIPISFHSGAFLGMNSLAILDFRPGSLGPMTSLRNRNAVRNRRQTRRADRSGYAKTSWRGIYSRDCSWIVAKFLLLIRQFCQAAAEKLPDGRITRCGTARHRRQHSTVRSRAQSSTSRLVIQPPFPPAKVGRASVCHGERARQVFISFGCYWSRTCD